MNPTQTHKHMTKVLEPLQAAIDIFYTNSYFLSPETVASLRRHLDRLGRHFQVLQHITLEEEKRVGRRKSAT